MTKTRQRILALTKSWRPGPTEYEQVLEQGMRDLFDRCVLEVLMGVSGSHD